MKYILILFYSRNGSTERLAYEIANGVESVQGIEAKIRTVPNVSPNFDATARDIPEAGAVFCEIDDFTKASGLAMGSPGRFGNMAAPLKYFLEQTTSSWVSGSMNGKPASLFTSTTTPHGGQESTLLSMMNPLLHHGMLITGVPFSEPALHKNVGGGTPYGVSHIAGENHDDLSPEIIKLAYNQGRRLAQYSLKLSSPQY